MARVAIAPHASKMLLKYQVMGCQKCGYQIEVVQTRVERKVSERIWADKSEVEELVRALKEGTVYPQEVLNVVTDFNADR